VTDPFFFVGPPHFAAKHSTHAALPASSTSAFPYLEAHFSRLPSGLTTPAQTPQAHVDEELIIVLNGSLRFAFSSTPTKRITPMDAPGRPEIPRPEIPVTPTSTSTIHDAPRGTVALHSAQNNHSLGAIDGGPAVYFCVRMVGARFADLLATRHEPLEVQPDHLVSTRILTPSARLLLTWQAAEGGATHTRVPGRGREDLLDSAVLAGGERLHIHATLTQPGGGYAPHTDTYDVLLLTLAGSIEITGPRQQRLGPYSLALLPAGSTHGLRNVGSTPSVHYAFELRPPAHD